MTSLHRYLLLLPLLILTANINAQVEQFPIRTFNKAYGLQYDFKKVVQDSTDFIWIMYRNAIQRFDGKTMRTFISGKNCNSLTVDEGGVVWASIEKDIYKFNAATLKFEKITSIDTNEKFLFQNGGNIFYITATGIFSYDSDADRFFENNSSLYSLPQELKLSRDYFSNFEKTLFYKVGDSICRHDLRNGIKDYETFNELRNVHALSRTEVIVSNWESKAWYYNFSNGIKQRIIEYPEDPTMTVLDAVPKDDLHFYIATFKGLLSYSPKQNVVEHLKLSLNGEPYPNQRINTLFTAKEDIIWGTTENSLFYFRNNNEGINFLKSGARTSSYQFSSDVRNFAQIHAGSLWMATDNGVTAWVLDTNTFVTLPMAEGAFNKINHPSIRGLVYDGENLIIGQTNKGLWLFNPNNGTFKRPYFKNGAIGDALRKKSEQDFVNQITTLQNGDHIVSARDGAYLIDGETYMVNDISVVQDAGTVRFAYQTSLDDIFLGTAKGLYCLDSSLSVKNKIPKDLIETQPFTMLAVDSGYYIGTQKGVYLLYEKNENPYLEKIIPQLENKWIKTIFKDRTQTIWLVTESKLHRYDPETKILTNFGFAENVRGDFFHPNSYFRNAEGLVFIGGTNGINYFYPEKVNLFPKKIKTYIKEISIAGKKHDADLLNVLKLNYNNQNISFSFATPYYGNQDNISYRYRLGNDDKWINLGNNQSFAVRGLPAGNYELQVSATLNKEQWHNAKATFPFIIKPPFWQQWWFVLGILALVGFFLYKWISNSQRKLKTEKMLNTFATSLYGQNTVDGILWDTARNCVQKLKFVDAVVYLVDHKQNVLIQKAAFGIKNPYGKKIINIMEIPFGKGIVGSVAQTGNSERIGNTDKDPRYVMDSEKALSEIAVPIWVDGKVFGVLDSEHPKQNFYKPYHLDLLKKIAAICSERLVKYLTEEQLRGKIARDLHDEMGSSLTSIQITSKIAAMDAADNTSVQKQLYQISRHTAGIMEKMSDLVWVVNPANDSLSKLIYRIKEYAVDILEPSGIELIYEEAPNFEDIKLNPEQRKNIYLIAKETLNNTVKYSDATQVSIAFSEKDQLLKMVILDNGKGFDPATIKMGNGLKNLSVRAEEINARLTLNSEKTKGTSVTILLQIDSASSKQMN